MFLVVTRNFPPDLGGIQFLMGGLSESLLNHGPVKVFAEEHENSIDYDSKSSLNIERIKGIKLFRKYRKANLVNNFINSNMFLEYKADASLLNKLGKLFSPMIVTPSKSIILLASDTGQFPEPSLDNPAAISTITDPSFIC